MISISSHDASRQFDALLTKVAEGEDHVSIQSPAHTPVYLISELATEPRPDGCKKLQG